LPRRREKTVVTTKDTKGTKSEELLLSSPFRAFRVFRGDLFLGGRFPVLRKPVVFITGASGEIGHGLITRLAEQGDRAIVTLDLYPLVPELAPKVQHQLVGSILDAQLLDRILAQFQIHPAFHLPPP